MEELLAMATVKTRIYQSLIALTFCFVFIPSCLAQDTVTKLDEYLGIVTKSDQFSGYVLVARDGKVLLSKGYGLANYENDVPNMPQTKFRLGSVTKQFTATAIMLLQERGKLKVQDPICKYLSECPAAWGEISIQQLLNHTAGVPNFTDFADYASTTAFNAPVEKLIARFRDKPLDFKPGSNFSYSNSGYVLLGAIVEKVSGKTYEDFLHENIFEPLKMANTGYDHHDQVLKNRAAGYIWRGTSLLNSAYIDMNIPYSAGALYSTVEDLYLWDQALYKENFLSRKSLDAMFTPGQGDYGYGWFITSPPGKGKLIAHGGGIKGFSTTIMRFVENKATIIVLSNFEDTNAGRVGRNLAAILFGDKFEMPKVHKTITLDPKHYDAFVGQYELQPGVILTITKSEDRLIGQVTNQGKFELFPESETGFFLRIVDAQVKFVKNDKGEVTHVIWHQGTDTQAKKIK